MAFNPRALAVNGVGYPPITYATNGVLFGGILPPLPEPIESALAGVIVLQSQYGLSPVDTLYGAVVQTLRSGAETLPVLSGIDTVRGIFGVTVRIARAGIDPLLQRLGYKTMSGPGVDVDDRDSGV